MANEFIIKGDGKINGTLNVGILGTGTSVNNLGIDTNGFIVSETSGTNTFTTGATLNGTVLEFDRTDSINAYNVDLSGFTSSNFANSNLTLTGNRAHELSGNTLYIGEGASIFPTITGGFLGITPTGAILANTVNRYVEVTNTKISFYNGNNVTDITSSTVTFNKNGDNVDLRVEGDIDLNLFFTDASTDRVGIGTNTPTEKLDVQGRTRIATIDNGVGDFATISGTGVLTRRTAAQTLSDIGGVSADTNFATTNLTFTGNREHDTNGNIFEITTDGGGYNAGWIYLDQNGGSNQGAWIGYRGNYIRSYLNVNELVNAANSIVQKTSETVFNDIGASVDFRVEGDTDVNLLFVDASTDRVGIGTNAPTAKLDVRGSSVFNENGNNFDLRVEGEEDINLLFVDASTDRVGIGTNTPNSKLTVIGQSESRTFKVLPDGTTNQSGDGNLIVNSDLIQFVTWAVNFTANRTLQISNLTDGKWVEVFISNSNANTRTITIQASTTTTGYVNVMCSNGSGGSTTSASLTASTGRRTVRVYRIGTTFAGSVH